MTHAIVFNHSMEPGGFTIRPTSDPAIRARRPIRLESGRAPKNAVIVITTQLADLAPERRLALASFLFLVIGFYGLPLDYLDRWVANVERVSVADIRAAFARRVKPTQFATVVVGAPE